jgi:hypothetical protein
MKLRTRMMQILSLSLVVGQGLGLNGWGARASAAGAAPASAERRTTSGPSLTQPYDKSRPLATPALQGQPALDYLKEHGLYDRLHSAMEKSQYEIFPLGPHASSAAPRGGETYAATNAAQHFQAHFSGEQLRLEPAQSVSSREWQANLKLRGYGYAGRMLRAGAGRMRVEGNRIEIEHARVGAPSGPCGERNRVTEWYVNNPEGLEQGFTLNGPPSVGMNPKATDEPLRLALEVTGGLRARLADSRRAIELRRANGEIALRYDHLSAQDASGRNLPARLEVNGSEIALVVEAAGAVYPVVIDPMFTQVQKLTASDGAVNDEFSEAVSISGDTVVAGSPVNSATGAAYVFNRNQGGADNWGQVKKITASDAPASGFGISLGISGDTIVVGAFAANALMGAAYVFERNQGGADNWGQVQKLTASDGVADDAFGFAVAVSSDTVVAGAFQHNHINGAAYVFERNQGGADNWGQVKELTTSDGIMMDELGASVAISGDTVLVGAPNQNSITGAVYVYERNQGGAENWGQTNRLTASDGAVNDGFGFAIAISGDTLVSGAFNKNGGMPGVAYVYERNQGGAGNWGQVQKLTTSDAGVGRFGFAVAISVDTIVVGAPFSTTTAGKAAGVVYTFSRNQGGAENWGEIQKLTPGDAATDDAFGDSIAIDGDTVVGGAPGKNSITGAAYTFNNQCGQWTQTRQTSPPSDAVPGDELGLSTAIDADILVAGAPAKNGTTGAAYIFARNQGGPDNWGLVKELIPSDLAQSEGFGGSVAIGGDTVVVGAPGKGSQVGKEVGAAYIFYRNQGGADNWGQVQKLTASDAAAGDTFGGAVGISGDTVVVGAQDKNLSTGAAYIYERNQGGADNWGQVRILTAADGATSDDFGDAVGISGDTVLIGALGSLSGAAYIYERNQGGAENWGQVRKLTASDAAAGDGFGASVGISGDTAVITAPFKNTAAGAVYIYERNQGGADNWGQVKILAGSGGPKGSGTVEGNVRFGSEVGISGDTIAVVATTATPSTDFPNAALVYGRNQGGAENWGQVQQLTASDGVAGDGFGLAVRISGDTIAVGAPLKNSIRGAVYLFNLSLSCGVPPPPTFNVCLKDDNTGNFIQWNSTTGAYLFTHCSPNGFTLSGTGVVGKVNGIETLTDKKPDRNITAGFNTGQLTGTAVVTIIAGPGLNTVYHINDTVPHAVCSCAG